MLPNTLTINGSSFTKISEDKQSGSVYLLDGSSRSNPTMLTVKHDVPALGRAGVARHLISYSAPMTDESTDTLTTNRVSVNFTINVPQVAYGDGDVTICLRNMLSALLGGTANSATAVAPDTATAATAFTSLVSAGHY